MSFEETEAKNAAAGAAKGQLLGAATDKKKTTTNPRPSEDSLAASSAPSGPKLYLLKLVEFNKIEVLEKYGFAAATVD